MTDTNLRDKLRAVFLVALMVGSVLGAGISFAGSAAADVSEDGTTIQVDGGGNNLSDAISQADPGDTIVVNDTSEYNPVTIDVQGLTVESADDANPSINATGQKTGVTIAANGTTFDGFEVIGDSATKDGVYISESNGDLYDVTVSNNVIHGMARASAGGGGNDNTTYAIHSGAMADDGFTITGNEIYDIGNTTYTDASPQAISLGQFINNETTIANNDISDLQSEDGDEYGILLYDDNVETNVSVTGNDIQGSSWDVYSFGTGVDLNGETNTRAKISSLYESNTNFVNVSVDGTDVTDSAGQPNVTDAQLLDTNDDGDLETVDVTLDEPVDDESLTASDFTIDGQTFDSISTGDTAYDNQFTLTLNDANAIDGTAKVSFNTDIVETDTTDLAGNGVNPVDQSNVVDSAGPVVDDVTFSPTVINRGNFGDDTTVTVDFSESVNKTDAGTFAFTPNLSGDLTVQEVNGDVVTAQTSLTPQSTTDQFLDLNISGAFEDESGQANTQVEFNDSDAEEGQDIYQVDLVRPTLSGNTVTTVDSDESGTVDRLQVDFNDQIDDSSVDTSEFTVSNPSATIDEWDTGDTVDDSTIYLNVSGLPADNTSVTPDLTVNADSLTDTAGNVGPADETTQTAEDGASPIVTDLTVNGSQSVTLNGSDMPADARINVTFSEGLTNEPTVDLLGISGGIATSSDGNDASDGQFNVTTNSQIDQITDSTSVYVNVSNGGDGSNTLVSFNESRITVDTQAPTVTVDATPIAGIVNGSVDISDNVSVSDAGGIDVIEVAVDDGDGYESYGEFASEDELNDSLSSFDTSAYDDGTITIKVNATDSAGNVAGDQTGSMSVDNTAPVVTINEPAQTTASQSGGTLDVNVSVDEANIADDNATVKLTNESGGFVQYNVSLADGDNEFSLRLNTSGSASADGAILPNLTATNTTFDTQTLYDLSVTVEDKTEQPATTSTKEDALFLDDTAPASFSLFEPNDDDPTEYDLADDSDELSDEIQIAYGYTEDNTDSVTVELTNESEGTVASTTVDESLYVDDGVVKSFELDLVDSFDDAGTLADGRYNVTVTVTDLAGNENSSSTSEAPVYINDDTPADAEPVFEEEADATAELNETTEEVAVDVTYNVSVPDVEDVGAINNEYDSLDNVTVTSPDDLVNVTTTYWDASEGEYVIEETASTGIFALNESATENTTITETMVVDLGDLDTGVDESEGDRVLDRSVDASGVVTVTATSDWDNTNSSSDTVTVASTTLEQQDAVEPAVENAEVDGVDTPSDSLTITFDRPIEPAATGDGVASDDFAYEDVSGDQTNYITSVDSVGSNTVEVTLASDVTAEDVGTDVVSIQPDVLQNSYSDENVSAVNSTFAETDAPVFTTNNVDVGDNASTVSVTFDQPVVAGDDGALTADNFTYSGAASVDSVDHDAESATATVHLDADVTQSELGSAQVEAHGVSDRFGNEASDSVTVIDDTNPSGLEIVEPTEQQIVQSGDLVDVTYKYVDNVPDNVESAQIELVQDGGPTYTYDVDDTSYVVDVNKSLTLDLDDNIEGQLADGSYDLTITVTDADNNEDFESFEDALVVNDEGPEVSDVSLNQTDNVAPDATLNVSYDYEPAPNATSVTVWAVDTDDIGNFADGDFENTTFAAYEQAVDHGVVDDNTVSVDLANELPDNDNYAVFVTATDVSGNSNVAAVLNGSQVGASLNLNAEQPTIESVEADTGDDHVTVKFNEDVTTTDGENITRADFAYQDVNNAGASSIESVEHMGAEVVLHLDGEVTASDLGSDLVNAADGALEDTEEQNPRPVDSDAVALSDSTDPSVGSISAGPINANNEDSYTVTVGTTSETTDVSVVLNGSNGAELSDSASSVTGEQSFTFNVSAFEDGPVDIDVELTDAAGNTASISTTVEKDTVAPTIEVAAANPGGSADAGGKTQVVTVMFSEAVDSSTLSADAFSVTSDEYSVDDVLPSSITAENEAVVLLNRSVAVDAIENESVQVAASGVTDEVGHAVGNAVTLTDEETDGIAAPSYTPGFDSVTAESGDTNVTVTFDEVVEAGDGGDLTAANFTFDDVNGASASAIESVTQTGPQTVVVTLDAPLTDADMAVDQLGVAADSVYDTSGNAMPADSTTLGLELGLSASAEDGAVTVQVTTLNDIETAIGDGLTVSEVNRELESLEGFELDERFTADVTAADFTEVEPGVYEASISVPVDDEYTEDGTYSVTGMVDGQLASAEATVDTTAPYPTDAVLLDVTSDAQYESTERNTTHIRVLFNEPIDASDITPRDVSIEGFDGDIVAVQDGGLLGSVEVVVEGKVQTGTHPTVTIDGDSYTDLAGTPGKDTGSKDSTVIHTDVLDLEKGQNYVSVPAASGDVPLDELDTSAVDAIYAYDAASGSWEAYDPDASENELTALEGGEGYIFVMDKAATIEVNAYNVAGAEAGADPSAPAPTQQSLTEGWNLIGQYQEYDQQVDTALSSLSDGSVYDVLAQDETADGVAFESHAAGDFQTLERSEGYWVFVQDDEVYTEASGHTAGTSTAQTAL